MNELDRQWSPFTKRAVSLILLLLFALVLYRFRSILPPLMVAFVLAFILNPIVGFVVRRLRVSRGLAVGIVFLVLVAAIVGAIAAPVTAVPNVVQAVRSAQFDFIRFTNDIGAFFEQPLIIGDYSLDLSGVYQELSAMLTSFVASVAEGTLDAVFDIASGAFWLIIILITAFYLVKDADRFLEGLDSLAPRGYREDSARIRRQIADVWNAFLRGQLVMGLVMVIITTVVCTAVGLPYAVVLGLIAGVTEFIPNIGPIIALVPAALVALFRGSLFLPLSNFWFMVLVIGLYMIIQQIEGNLILPRIMGQSLDLHPLVVMIGIIIGGNLTGILGMLLAAPVLATLRVIGVYVVSRLNDRDPFAQSEHVTLEPSFLERACRAAWDELQEKITERKSEEAIAQIRPAQAEDRPAVEALCAKRERDYVPGMWDEWVIDPHGSLTLAELNGQVVGFAKLTRLADNEWWQQGLRVDPDYQGQGIAGQLQDNQIETARRIGRGTLRYGTHSSNEPVHHLAARYHFRHTATYQRYQAEATAPDGPDAPDANTGTASALHQCTEADILAVWALITCSPCYQASSGLYEDFWIWKNLTRERLACHLAAGDVWGREAPEPREEEGLSAVALVQMAEDTGTLHIGYVDGTEETLVPLMQELRELAVQLDCTEVMINPVNEPRLLAALEAASYIRDQSHDLWIFELKLDGR